MIRLHLILSYVVSYPCILSYSSLDLCLVLCTLPPLISYSLAPSSIMMSCTVHSPMDSLAQPSCILVYILYNPAPRGSPFELSLGLRSKLPSPTLSPSSQSSCVCWFLVLWPWVASSAVTMTTITLPFHSDTLGSQLSAVKCCQHG